MKKTLTTLTLALFVSFVWSAWDYHGPDDERTPEWLGFNPALGDYARTMAVGAVADVIEDVTEWTTPIAPGHPAYLFGHLKVRVVTPIYGCTNGQEIVLIKSDPRPSGRELPKDFDPNFEYYPTNNSRIVFATTTSHNLWTPKIWKQPPEPEVILSPDDKPILYNSTRQWWYDGWQDNVPYTHLTNLVHVMRVERNWTNYYHAVRDAVPTPASPRVWQDSFYDMSDLLWYATEAQFQYILNDPLFPAEMRERRQDYYLRFRRYGEDE